jgi:hypothetical protein
MVDSVGVSSSVAGALLLAGAHSSAGPMVAGRILVCTLKNKLAFFFIAKKIRSVAGSYAGLPWQARDSHE